MYTTPARDPPPIKTPCGRWQSYESWICLALNLTKVTKLLPQSTFGQLTVIRLVLHDSRRVKIENLTQCVPDSLLLAIGTL
jgi:hypothetical protein